MTLYEGKFIDLSDLVKFKRQHYKQEGSTRLIPDLNFSSRLLMQRRPTFLTIDYLPIFTFNICRWLVYIGIQSKFSVVFLAQHLDNSSRIQLVVVLVFLSDQKIK